MKKIPVLPELVISEVVNMSAPHLMSNYLSSSLMNSIQEYCKLWEVKVTY